LAGFGQSEEVIIGLLYVCQCRCVAPHFITTKFEAFKDRGNDDYLTSHDIKDILTVISGRVELVEAIKSCDPELKDYLVENFETSNSLGLKHYFVVMLFINS
jgi:hypothetical protein